MSLFIKGMELPEENHDYGGVKVWVDLRVYTDGSVLCRNLAGDFVDLGKCAVEVPTPHGRLGDLDELKKQAYPFPCAIGVEHAVTIRAINEMPTIIEAER